MKVANVLPGDTISVELKYTELLVPTEGLYEFVYPTVVGPRYSEKRESQASPGDEFVKTPYMHEGESPRSEFHLSGVVSTGVPLQELASPSHQLVVRSTGQGRCGGGARRFRATVRQSRLHPSLPVSWRRDSVGTAAVSGPDEKFFLLDGGAAAGRPSPTRCRRASTSSCSMCRDRCTVFRWTQRRS